MKRGCEVVCVHVRERERMSARGTLESLQKLLALPLSGDWCP